MAAFNRPTEATYAVHEKIVVDTDDNEDHTFCGIMFPVKCKDLIPLDHVVINSVAVRGRLGPLTVWVSNESQHAHSDGAQEARQQVRLDPRCWTKLYDKRHRSSRTSYTELRLDTPIRLKPGETRVIYVHSTLDGDEAIVYDNSSYRGNSSRFEDEHIAIMSGRAHVSPTVFGQDPIWGWGNAWRDRREFVGRLGYGIVYKLWNPQVQPKFGSNFQDGARALFLCQRRWESPFSNLPDECIFYILNMCRWNWFDDTSDDMKELRRREKTRVAKRKEEAAQRALADVQREEEQRVDTAVPMEDAKPAAGCARRAKTDRVFQDEEEHVCDTEMAGEHEDEGDEDYIDDMEDDEDDDDDDDEDFVAGEDEDEEEGFDSDTDDEDQYRRANIESFSYRLVDSDDEEEEDNDGTAHATSNANAWFMGRLARIHVLQALAAMDDDVVAQLRF